MEKVITFDLQDSFIDKLVEFVDATYLRKGKDISRIAFVFGGKRPSLYLARELSRKIGKSYIPPVFFSIDEYIEKIVSSHENISRLGDMDACYMIFTLLCEQKSHLLNERMRFSQFLPWAREVVAFLDRIDLEQVDSGKLKNLQASAQIGYEIPQNINAILSDIIHLREMFHFRMKEQKEYSRGFLYKQAAELSKKTVSEDYDEIFFCNFFYMHRTEKEIISHLYKNDKARLFFQGDEDSWPVLKEIGEYFNCSIRSRDRKKKTASFSLHAGFDKHSQAGIVREIVKEIEDNKKSVIVLPDPESLIPLLSEVASFAGDFNVSMGYPIKRNALWSLFVNMFKAQETKKNKHYYVKEYMKVLGHPFIKNLVFGTDLSVTRVLIHKIEEVLKGIINGPLAGAVFVTLPQVVNSVELYAGASETLHAMGIEVDETELMNILATLHEFLFALWENVSDFSAFSQRLGKLMDLLVERSCLKPYPLNLSFFERLYIIKDEFATASFKNEIFEADEIFRIFLNKLENGKISFKGSPLKGMQILGLFETRALNFDTVIITDANESVLPGNRKYEPLIPGEIMAMLGIQHQDEAIERYLFRRLIESAKKVHIVYAENKDEKKERSRFVEELVWEQEKKYGTSGIVIEKKYSFNVSVRPTIKKVEKTSEIVRFLENRTYSASSVNLYLKCPLQFYYRYVLGIEETKELSEDIEARDVGTFLHELLETAYAGFIGRKPCIDEAFKTAFFNEFDTKFTLEFDKRMKSDSFALKEIMRFRLQAFLDKEQERMPMISELVGLEKKVEGTVCLNKSQRSFIAYIDRIDKNSEGNIVIIDYKSGGEGLLPAAVERVEQLSLSRESIRDTVKSFQLPLYMLLVKQNMNLFFSDPDNNFNCEALLYYIRNASIKSFPAKKEEYTSDEVIDIFLKPLRFILQEITDLEKAFSADKSNERLCAYCPYKGLC